MSTAYSEIEELVEDFRASTARVAKAAATIRTKTIRPGEILISAEGIADREVNISQGNFLKVFLQIEHDLRHQAALGSPHLRDRLSTKQQAKTVGVYAKSGLWDALACLAIERNQKQSVIYRDLLRMGVKDLDKRFDKESSSKVFSELGSLLESYDGLKEQRMVRIEEDFYNRAIFVAKEFGKSLSEIATLSMAYGLSKVSASHLVPATDEIARS